MNYNTRISIEPGLQDTYQVFNLDAQYVYNNVKVEVIIDGDLYVENDTPLVIHAGNSNFKQFEGINNEVSNVWDLSNYGEKFRSLLLRYFNNHASAINSSRGFDIYENELAYKNYKNLFTVIFKDKADTDIHIIGQYLGYMQNPVDANEKSCISRLLKDVNGSDSSKYIFINTNIIHYSKYYNVYKSSDISVPVLLPVLYTEEDLHKFNMTVYNNNVWINSLSTFTAYNDDNGSHRDHRAEYRYECDPLTGKFPVTADPINNFSHSANVNWSYSQFKQHSSGKHFVTELEEVSEEKYSDYFPSGFMFFTLSYDSNSICINTKNARSDEHAHSKVPALWQQWFSSRDYTYWISLHGFANRVGDNTILAGLYYRGDKEDNVHLLNCWFTLKASGSNDDNRVVTQEIAYKSGYANKKPKYIGTCIASIFANIYQYVQDSNTPITLIIDMVYLSEHNTTYTKDIIYRASVEANDMPGKDPSALLIFKGIMKYGGDDGYVELVKRMAGTDNDPQYSGDKNVKAVIHSCVKNVPLQYKLAYKEPNTDLLNANNDFYLLKTIDNPSSTRVYGKLSPNRLYLLDYGTDGKPVVTFLNTNFKIRYLESIALNQDTRTISGKFSKLFLEDNNPYISSTWDINNNLTLSNYKYQSISSRYYSLLTMYSDWEVLYADYDKNEILLPFAKFV